MTQPPAATSRASARDPGSYRDPSGFVYQRDGRLLRQVNTSFADDWSALAERGLLDALWQRRLLVRHREVEADLAAEPGAIAVVEPERIPFISYPFEWTFSQLQDAALLTLDAQLLAERHGMTLRDASAYNVQVADGRPILIDTLSFKRLDADAPWEPYRQFCEHFLAPLALMARRDPRLGLMLRDFVDGIPLDLASRLLPGRTRLAPGLAAHLHVHARAQSRHQHRGERPARVRMSANRRAALLDHLRRTVSGLKVDPSDTTWSDYADNTSYESAAAAGKEGAVADMLRAIGGASAIDLGANTGRFSALAADAGYRVVAPDLDWAAAERHYRAVRGRDDARILPLVADIANPSPALGWAGRERSGLLERLRGDVVMALALVHHLAIGRNVPLTLVAETLAMLAPNLVIEWVPKEDPMVQRLLAAREDVFPGYVEEAFLREFERHYRVAARVPLAASHRVLFQMKAGA